LLLTVVNLTKYSTGLTIFGSLKRPASATQTLLPLAGTSRFWYKSAAFSAPVGLEQERRVVQSEMIHVCTPNTHTHRNGSEGCPNQGLCNGCVED